MQNDDDDPTGRNPDARQADYTNAPSSARRCLAARDADFIEASGHMCRTKRPDIWAHRLPQDKVSITSLARRGRSTYGITHRRHRQGKSHLAIAIARALVRSGTRGRFFNVVDLINRLQTEHRTGKQGRIADYLTRLDFVVLDELGYLPFARPARR